MRFSLKWILAAAVYVAVAAAAFSQPSWVYADILWAISLLAIVFAGLVTFVGSSKARLAAGGFLLASACFLVYVTAAALIGNNATPMTRLLVAAGYEPFQPGPYYYTPTATVQPAAPIAAAPIPADPSATLSLSFAPPAVAASPIPAAPIVDFAQYVRAANAVGMIGFGLLGMLMGALALRAVALRPAQ
ncbi:MAG TPA: hypothetical protein VF175_02635 [Lacipirellula sp.]